MKVNLLNRLMGHAMPGACEPCMPRTHEEMLLDHERRKDQQRKHNQLHEYRFVPR